MNCLFFTKRFRRRCATGWHGRPGRCTSRGSEIFFPWRTSARYSASTAVRCRELWPGTKVELTMIVAAGTASSGFRAGGERLRT